MCDVGFPKLSFHLRESFYSQAAPIIHHKKSKMEFLGQSDGLLGIDSHDWPKKHDGLKG